MQGPYIVLVGLFPALVLAAALGLGFHLLVIRSRSTGGLRCPSCGNRDVRHSAVGRPRDYLYRWFSCVPFRCRSCRARFFRYEGATEEVVS